MKPPLVIKFVFFFIVINIKLYSQQDNLRFEDKTTELDVAGVFINNIQQDSQGYLWIASTDGLFKYDGYTAIKYRYNPFDAHSVSQNFIYTFFIDKTDTMWLGTPEGLCKFDRHTEKFTRYNTALIPAMPDLGNVSAINEDEEGNLWIANHEGKLWRFNRAKGTFLSMTARLWGLRQESLATVFHDDADFIYKDRNGIIWIGTNNGLHRLDIKPGKPGEEPEMSFTHYQHDSSDVNSLSSNLVVAIKQDHNGVFWIGTFSGLNSFDIKTGKFTRFLPNASNPFSISSEKIRSIVEDRDGNIWIGTENGLNKLNKARTSFTKWFENSNQEFGLKSGNIYELGLDAGGNLFVSTDKALQSLMLNQKAFGLLQHHPEDINSISDIGVSSIAEDSWGNIWIGTPSGGLNKWDKATGKITHFQHDPDNKNSLRNNFIGAILNDPGGDIWVANTEYLSRLKNGSAVFEHFNSNSRNLKNSDAISIYSICRDKDGLIWLGTGNGIKNFDPVTKKFNHYFYEAGNPNGISDYTVMSILADSRGNIWVANNSIAFDKFDKRTGRFTHYKNNVQDSTSISSNTVNAVFEDSKGNLWLGTQGGGLCQYNYTANNFITHTRNKDIPWNTIFSIQEDNQGNIWLGTEKGLCCYLVSKKTFITYDIKDGLQSNLFAAGNFRVEGSALKGKEGVLYFGGYKGLNYFDPAQISLNNFIPPVVITQFKIFDKLQPGKNEDSEIVLNYNQNFFSFEFAALNYTNTSKNQYAYQLEGFDPDWVYSGSRRYTGYTNLNPGKYIFKVKASNNDGIWNEKGISILVTILPPLWKTWWAFGIYGLLLMAAIWLIHRYQKQRVILAEREKAQKKELAQAKEIEKAYHELKTTQQQLIQSEKMASLGELTAGIAHEIQNPLNFVNNFSEVNKELLAEMNEEIDKGNFNEVKAISKDVIDNEEKIIHHGKRADAIVKGMLQHSRSSSGVKEPTDINALADEYLRLAYHGLRAKDNSFNATIKTDFDKSTGNIHIIRQDIGRAILNLLTNAFYAVSEKKKQIGDGYEPTVSVSTGKQKDKVEIRVKDNGNGIPQKVLDKIFQPFFTTKPTGQGTGLGLSLSYDIIKAHGGELRVNTKEGEYAEFIIQLPVIND